MKMKLNVPQLVCALLTLLAFFLIPFVAFGVPGVRIALYKVTALQLMEHVNQWMALPLVFAVAMLIVALLSQRTATLAVGGLTLLGMIVLGASLSSLLANSGLTQLINTAASSITQTNISVSGLVDVISSAGAWLYLGYYLYLLFTVLFIVGGLLELGSTPTRGGGGGRVNVAPPNNRGGMYK